VPYRILVGGDEVVDRSIEPRDLRGVRVLLSPAPQDLLPADRAAVEGAAPGTRRVSSAVEAIAAARTVVSVEGGAPVRLLPRVGPGGAVVHVLSRDYAREGDAVRTLRDVRLAADLEALGVASCRRARVIGPGSAPVEVAVENGRVLIPSVGLWTLVHFDRA
jgi:hypothetical protein